MRWQVFKAADGSVGVDRTDSYDFAPEDFLGEANSPEEVISLVNGRAECIDVTIWYDEDSDAEGGKIVRLLGDNHAVRFYAD